MKTIVAFALNGEAIRLRDMKVTPTMQFQDKDQSGQTSSTAKTEQGIKAKELRVSGVIPFSEAGILKRIFELAQSRGGNGKLKVYRVANLTANTIGFREGVFTGTIDAPPLDGKMAWLVTFTLSERQSVPEKREARANAKISAQKQSGVNGSSGGGDESDKLSWFESTVLKPINDVLGPSSDETN